MSKIEVNQISSQCGATLTIGQSGDTVTLASGATQTGFGRTGTVDWCTTAKTAPFTGVSGKGYFVNTSCGAITVTLPASPSAGDIISVADYTNTWQTNGVTICKNGSKIGGICANASLSTEGQSITLVYVDATEGWKNVQDSTSNVIGFTGMTATGGTITCCGNYKIHTFTSSGTFCVSALSNNPTYNKVDYLVVAGGAGGVTSGGGAGGYRESHCATISGCYTASPLASATSLPVSVQSYPITVGAGGSGISTVPGNPDGGAGGVSTFSTITSAGGGGGVHECSNGIAGASGGGGGGGGNTPYTGGAGNTPPTNPPQGNAGGNAPVTPPANSPAGGGGAGQAGQLPQPTAGGAGGTGAGTAINPATGTPGPTPGIKYYSGGGGGGVRNCAAFSAGLGGAGGGGDGAPYSPASGTAGTANTGGGGGGASRDFSAVGGNGASGIVIIRYKYQ